jgi:hypothetical protein
MPFSWRMTLSILFEMEEIYLVVLRGYFCLNEKHGAQKTSGNQGSLNLRLRLLKFSYYVFCVYTLKEKKNINKQLKI